MVMHLLVLSARSPADERYKDDHGTGDRGR